MYRLNCNLPDDLGCRLSDYSKKTGVAKVNVVILALNDYLNEQEYKAKLLEQMSNPNTIANLLLELGCDNEKISQLLSEETK